MHCYLLLNHTPSGKIKHKRQSCLYSWSYLNVKVHQFSLVQQVVDPTGLQPAKCLLLPAAQVNENTQTALGVIKSCLVCSENIQKLKLLLQTYNSKHQVSITS